jgi:hypothetical protein
LAATSPPRKRFLREARASAAIRHENVVQVYAIEEQPLPYLVMEFIPGETLQQRLERTGPLEVTDVVEIGRQTAEGLAAAHAQGLIHRDIKPGNILLDVGPRPRAKITDFGLARAADDASMTQSGLLAGTPMFMSPEQAKGESLDHRTDLFSLGTVLYTMITGRPPFRADGTLAILKRVAEHTPRPIPEIIPEVPRWLCDIIARLHAKDPVDRFSSAKEVAEALTSPQADPQPHGLSLPASTGARVEPPGESPFRRRRSHSGLWAATAVALILGLASLSITEATGVTDLHGSVIRLFSPEGTLVVEVDDPGLSVLIDGEDLVIAGAGLQEVRLRTGQHMLQAVKNGKVVRREVVTVAKNGRQVVRVSREAERSGEMTDSVQPNRILPGESVEWEHAVAALPPQEQVDAVVARLKQLNPNFDGSVASTIEHGTVRELRFSTVEVTDISPVRALTELKSLICGGIEGQGKLADLSPLRGMRLTTLECHNTRVSDLSPLRGMPLKGLAVHDTATSDLGPLEEGELEWLNCSHTPVADLLPLRGMKLTALYLDITNVSDLSPLKGMPLERLNLRGYPVRADRDGEVLRSFDRLETINSELAADFLRELDAASHEDRR